MANGTLPLMTTWPTPLGKHQLCPYELVNSTYKDFIFNTRLCLAAHRHGKNIARDSCAIPS